MKRCSASLQTTSGAKAPGAGLRQASPVKVSAKADKGAPAATPTTNSQAPQGKAMRRMVRHRLRPPSKDGRLSGRSDRNKGMSAKTTSHGGQREIRTLDTREGIHAFQACALNHSAICPQGERLSNSESRNRDKAPDYSARLSWSKVKVRLESRRFLPFGAFLPGCVNLEHASAVK